MSKLYLVKKIVKPKSLLLVPVALISLEIYFGIIGGYFLAKFYVEKICGKKIGKFLTCGSIFIPLNSKYKIHLHHWLYPSLILAGGSIFHVSFLLSPFLIGFFSGIASHDIVTDRDWYKVVKKREIKNFNAVN